MLQVADLSSESWPKLLSEFPDECQDVYSSFGYHKLHQANGEGTAQASLISDGVQRLLVPGLRIPIANAATSTPSGYSDLQTCNGYCGPLAAGEPTSEFISAAWELWRTHAAAKGIVAAFFRLHPLMNNARWLPPDATIQFDRQTVLVDLRPGLEEVWKSAESQHRNMVNKGKKDGLSIEWSRTDDWIDFEELYSDAMRRLNAPQALRFSSHYFALIRTLPGAELAAARVNGKLSAAAIFLFGKCWSHYHLSARAEGSPNYLTNCLLQAAIERSSSLSLQGLHLGGGRTTSPQDSLFKFKRSLGGPLMDFKVARVIAHPSRFGSLCDEWARLAGKRPQWLLGYRQPITCPVSSGLT